MKPEVAEKIIGRNLMNVIWDIHDNAKLLEATRERAAPVTLEAAIQNFIYLKRIITEVTTDNPLEKDALILGILDTIRVAFDYPIGDAKKTWEEMFKSVEKAEKEEEDGLHPAG